jgi:hypothetical protein
MDGLVWTLPCEDGITVTAAQLQHRVPCWGYVFQEASRPPLPDPALMSSAGVSEVGCTAKLHLPTSLFPAPPPIHKSCANLYDIAKISRGWPAVAASSRRSQGPRCLIRH